VLLVAALLVTACTDDDKDAGPPPTTRAPSSTSLVDLSGVELPAVGGETTTTIIETGTARLVGTVTGPDGPLAGATVRVDRLVAGREVRRDVVSGADGRWELRGVPGGRYRVRAFLAPTYAQTTPELRFLADGEEHTFDLQVEDQRGVVVQADVAPDQPVVGAPVNLVVLVVQRTVGTDGVVRSSPMTGETVELTGLGAWRPRSEVEAESSEGSTTTSGDSTRASARLSAAGRARFELWCVERGEPGLTLVVPSLVAPSTPSGGSSTSTSAAPTPTERVPLMLPACAARGARSTTTTAP
jgi:hypothetical protein